MGATHRIYINTIRKNGKYQMCWSHGKHRKVLGDVPAELGKILQNVYCISSDRAKVIVTKGIEAYNKWTPEDRLPLDSRIIIATMFE
jgi:hypothetical protein